MSGPFALPLLAVSGARTAKRAVLEHPAKSMVTVVSMAPPGYTESVRDHQQFHHGWPFDDGLGVTRLVSDVEAPLLPAHRGGVQILAGEGAREGRGSDAVGIFVARLRRTKQLVALSGPSVCLQAAGK